MSEADAKPDAPDPPPGTGVFASFTIPSYRHQWFSDVLSAWASEMETIILAWYVLVATDSPFLLSVVAALRFGGTLVAPFTGVVVDRVARRTVLLALRVTFAVLAGSLALAGVNDALALWYVFAVATLSGLLRPTEMVVRQSLIADSVPRHLLTNAMGFGRTTMESARVIGALAGAGLLSLLGIGPAYVGVTAIYVVSIAFTLRISPIRRRRLAAPAAPLADLMAGFRYIRGAPAIVVVMWLAFLVNLTAFPVTQGFLPVLARDTFGFDENGLARMVATVAAGALAGSIVIAVLMRSARPERTMFVGLVGWHLALVALAFVESPAAAYVTLVFIGILTVTAMVPMSVVLLGQADAEFRGRVMGVRMLAVYGLPMGLLLGGAMIERLGVTTSLVAFGVAGLVPPLYAAWNWTRWTTPTS